jgi:hypothetical protein
VNDAAAFAELDRRNRIAEYEAQIAALEIERDALVAHIHSVEHAAEDAEEAGHRLAALLIRRALAGGS